MFPQKLEVWQRHMFETLTSAEIGGGERRNWGSRAQDFGAYEANTLYFEATVH